MGFADNKSVSPNTVPVIFYEPVSPDSGKHGAMVSDSGYAKYSGSTLVPEVKQMDERAIAVAIQTVRAAICGSSENVDARVWMSFDVHGDVGMVVQAGAAAQSGFEVIFHCGKFKKTKL